MTASPVWLETIVRTTAHRDVARRTAREAGIWGAFRFSRRRAVGGAASALVAASVLRYAPAAAAAPACQNPCLQDAANDFAKSEKFAKKFFGGEADRLEGKISRLESKLSHTKGSKARSKIQGQIAGLQRRELQVLNSWQGQRSGNYDSFLDDGKDCKSNSNCGNSDKYPDGFNPPTPPQQSSCGADTQKCAENCCPGGTQCCKCKVCCIVEVTCADCCGGGS